jgi:GNAT superfamily N-acetyltransferase
LTSETQIRQATPQDAVIVADILKEGARWLEQAGMPLWRDENLEFARVAADVNAGLFFVAELSGESAGIVKFQLEDLAYWPDMRQHDAAYVHRLAIRRRFAGTGLSIAILRWAVPRTHTLGRQSLRLDCPASRPRLRAFYEDFGFRHHSDEQLGDYMASRYEYDVTKLTSKEIAQ